VRAHDDARLFFETNAGVSTPVTHRIATGEDAHCQLLEWRTSGKPVLLLHGLASNSGTWLTFARELDERYRPLALDLRGHGDSSWRSEYRIESLVHDLERVRDWIGAPFALIGHSLGGEVAAQFTARHPRSVRALILVDVGAQMNARARQRIHANLAAAVGDYASPEEYLDELRESYLLADESALRHVATHGVRRERDGRYRPKLDPTLRGRIDASPLTRATPSLPELWDALTGIHTPTLVLRGEVSGVLGRETAQHMALRLPAARLEQIPRAGHALMLDNPAAFARAACAFLEETLSC
jgi:pimeloyl-ACP methyl ester carboxylesterase